MISNGSFVAALLVMASCALATRLAGASLMRRVKGTKKTERFLEGLAAAVIAALVASGIVSTDASNVVAVGVAIAVVILTQSVVGAMVGGMIAAAAITFVAPS